MLTATAPWWLALMLALSIALAAWRAGSLHWSGALAAFFIGASALRAQSGWGVFLIVWFVLASVLSRVGRDVKARRTTDIIAKGDRRDAWQVLANGGVFALCTCFVLVGVASTSTLAAAAAASLAAAGADTWSTEIGTLRGGTPWSLRERSQVAAGTSGAISLAGSLGGLAGAMVLTAVAAAVRMIPASQMLPVFVGALAGSWTDSVVGAWLQERRWCSVCLRPTERPVHSCGTLTEHIGGWRRLDNDAVNSLCTAVGAAVAYLLARLLA